MPQLGANADGEVLVPGRVPDCYFGLLLDPPRDQRVGSVLVVAPASLLDPCVPQLGFLGGSDLESCGKFHAAIPMRARLA